MICVGTRLAVFVENQDGLLWTGDTYLTVITYSCTIMYQGIQLDRKRQVLPYAYRTVLTNVSICNDQEPVQNLSSLTCGSWAARVLYCIIDQILYV